MEEEEVVVMDQAGEVVVPAGLGGLRMCIAERISENFSISTRGKTVCVDLYQPAFYSKKPNWENLAEFVYSVLSVGSTSVPGLMQQLRMFSCTL